MKDSTINDFGAQLKRVVQYTQTESDGRWTKATNNQTQRKSVRERLSKYTAKYIVADWVEIHVGKRPDSIGSDGDGLPWQEAIGLIACQFAAVTRRQVRAQIRCNFGERVLSIFLVKILAATFDSLIFTAA